jgi:radical SAM protein with 4Fe4S-binding SPASM domain
MGLRLSSDYVLRRDVDRFILYPKYDFESAEGEFVRILHPLDALILALFDGKRDKDQVAKIWSHLAKLDNVAESKKYIHNFLSMPVKRNIAIRDLLTEQRSIKVAVDPKEYYIPFNNVNVHDLRCRIPIRLMYMPTIQCATDCIYCYADKKHINTERDLSLKRIKEILIESRELGIYSIQFSGGEPFLREGIFAILRMIKYLGMKCSLPTKYPLSKPEIRVLFELMEAVNLQISIDAADERVIDQMANTIGYAKKILETLSDLSNSGIEIRTNTVVTPYNSNQIAKLIKLLANLNNVYRINLTTYSRSLYKERGDLFLDNKKIEYIKMYINDIKAKYDNIEFNLSGAFANRTDEITRDNQPFYERPLCTAGLWGFAILPDGKVTVCEELYWNPKYIIGDLKRQNVLGMWSSEKAKNVRSKIRSEYKGSPCNDCPDFEECINGLGRCIRDVIKAYGQENDYYPDPKCPRAPTGQRIY